MSLAEVHFGGPDCPVGALRNLLAERIAAVPTGGAIDWVTYYFRDRRLAADLAAARRRGVEVRVTLEGHPRTPHANDAVIALLAPVLQRGLRVVRCATELTPLARLVRPRLHEKLYCFSHPQPIAMVGSFNPSGDQPEQEQAVLLEIGDHDRGHNLLVELRAPELVSALVTHARRLHGARHGPFDRFERAANRPLVFGDLTVLFWPRVRPDPILHRLARLEPASRLRLVASHISGARSRRTLLGLAARGVAVEILAEATHRRVPTALEQDLVAAGIPIRRLVYQPWVPMHNKFALLDTAGERSVTFGSFNWTGPSRCLNREIGIVTRDPELFESFAARWDFLSKEADGHASG